jgi:hypothetical protein
MGSTLDDLNKRQRRKSFLLDRFVHATLGVGHPITQAGLFPRKVGDGLKNHSIVDTHILVILATECHNWLMGYGIKCTLQLFEEIVISQ